MRRFDWAGRALTFESLVWQPRCHWDTPQKTGGFASPPFDGFAFVTQWNMQQSSRELNSRSVIKLRCARSGGGPCRFGVRPAQGKSHTAARRFESPGRFSGASKLAEDVLRARDLEFAGPLDEEVLHHAIFDHDGEALAPDSHGDGSSGHSGLNPMAITEACTSC